jgi:hypothetical protein
MLGRNPADSIILKARWTATKSCTPQQADNQAMPPVALSVTRHTSQIPFRKTLPRRWK